MLSLSKNHDASNSSNWYVDADETKRLYATGMDYGALTPMLAEAIKEIRNFYNRQKPTGRAAKNNCQLE